MIDPALLQQIADCYAHHPGDPATLERLREQFPAVRFTHCSDDDIGRARPIMSGNGFNLYLVGGEQCLSLTSSFDNAKGVVVADVDEEAGEDPL